jgi:indole-3-glycerol phosphate synthase
MIPLPGRSVTRHNDTLHTVSRDADTVQRVFASMAQNSVVLVVGSGCNAHVAVKRMAHDAAGVMMLALQVAVNAAVAVATAKVALLAVHVAVNVALAVSVVNA